MDTKKILDAFMAANMKSSLSKASPKYDPEEHNMGSRKEYTNTPVVIIGAGISGKQLNPTARIDSRQ